MEIRWVQRFENYKQALLNLSETVDCIKREGNSKIYTMALVQAFEMTFELAWKTLKDYLEYSGIVVDTPRTTIKEAFRRNFIFDGQSWIEMMEARNKTSHTYKEEFAKSLCNEILTKYFNLFNELSIFLERKVDE